MKVLVFSNLLINSSLLEIKVHWIFKHFVSFSKNSNPLNTRDLLVQQAHKTNHKNHQFNSTKPKKKMKTSVLTKSEPLTLPISTSKHPIQMEQPKISVYASAKNKEAWDKIAIPETWMLYLRLLSKIWIPYLLVLLLYRFQIWVKLWPMDIIISFWPNLKRKNNTSSKLKELEACIWKL